MKAKIKIVLYSVCFLVGCFSQIEAQNLTPYKDKVFGIEKYGFKDKTGKFVIAPKYDAASIISDVLYRVKSNGRWGLINEAGKEITPIKYRYPPSFKEGFASVHHAGKAGYINEAGV